LRASWREPLFPGAARVKAILWIVGIIFLIGLLVVIGVFDLIF
jgi:hypothetical protein